MNQGYKSFEDLQAWKLAREFKNHLYQLFCRIARGSVNECLDHLYTALDQGYIMKPQFDNLYAEGREVEHAINGYLKFLRSQSQ